MMRAGQDQRRALGLRPRLVEGVADGIGVHPVDARPCASRTPAKRAATSSENVRSRVPARVMWFWS